MASILIDALGADSPGARLQLTGLLPALPARAGGHRFRFALRRSAAQALAPTEPGAVELWPIADRVSRGIVSRALLDWLYIPYHAARGRFDLVVTLANFGPLWTPTPHLVFQQNALHFSEEGLGRLRGLQRVEWRLRSWLSALEMRWATLIVTPTDAMAGLIKAAYPSLASRSFATLFHGADLSRYGDAPPRSAARPFLFLCPTKIEGYKGIDVLLPAVRLLARERDDFAVQITTADRGWPSAVQRLIDEARRQPWFGRVRFAGAQPPERMPEAYRAADGLVYPSFCESFGFPLLEAMACGLPIVAGELEVNRELCQAAARYYAVGSAEALAAALRDVLVNEGLRNELRAACRARIRSRDWSWDDCARRFVELCEQALSARG